MASFGVGVGVHGGQGRTRGVGRTLLLRQARSTCNDKESDVKRSHGARTPEVVRPSYSSINTGMGAEMKDGSGLGDFEPEKKIPVKREVIVGDPQQKVVKEKESVTSILRELAAIQSQGPQKYCLLGTRHCSFLHQTIIELL